MLLWNNIYFNDISGSLLVNDNAEQTNYNYGKHFFNFNMLDTYVEYCESNYIDMSYNKKLC